MTASLPSLADSLIQALHQPGQERLLDLVRNPLRLTLLCITWDGTLPETQAQLYENYLKKFYDWNQNLQELRDCAERCQTNITALKKQLNQQLGELAKAALDLPQERFRLSQSLVEKYLGEELDDKSLCYLALQLGWLNRVGKDNRGQFIFAFYHTTFQEYFAALAVDDWDYFLPSNHINFPVAGKEYRIFEPQWKQVIVLWLGREDVNKDNKQAFIKGLLAFEDNCQGFYQLQAYFLAAAGIAEFNDFDEPDIINEIIDQLVLWWFGHPDFENQEWLMYSTYIEKAAAIALKETDRLKAINALTGLLQTLQHESERYRFRVAAFILDIDLNNSEAKATLTDLLNSRTYREAAASILSEKNLNEPEAKRIVDNHKKLPEEINQISKFLKSFQEKKLQAIKALETCNDVNYLISQLRDGFEIKQDGKTSVKNTFTAAKARLAEIGIGDITIIKALLQLLFTKHSAFLCRHIIGLFKQIINTNLLYFSVVNILSEYLDGNVIELSCDSSKCAIEIFSYCAQNLPYPDFYRAWHRLTKTEALNLAQLPQLLQTQLTETNLHQTLQLFCIDGSKFDNRAR